MVSQKCQYALRAVFDLARRDGSRPTKIADVAEAQAIPPRFLEVILGQLKQGGFVVSRRGAEGGYMLARPGNQITVGEIIRFVEGPLGPVGCVSDEAEFGCPLHGDCVFLSMWESVKDAVSGIYDSTTLEDLVQEDARRKRHYVPSYVI